jgi:peptide/nickel transport system substrate-binding protein
MRSKVVTGIVTFGIAATLVFSQVASVPGVARAMLSHASTSTLTIAQGVDPVTLDAQMTTVQQALNVDMEINEPLDRLDYKTHKLEHVLATSIKYVGHKTWRAQLRKGVKFTDGEAFNANAVKYSIDRIMQPSLKAPTVDFVATVKSVKVVNPYEVDFKMKVLDPTLPLELTQIGMVPPKYVKQVGDAAFGQKPVGTGPYALVQWVKDDHVTLRRNPKYWGKTPSVQTLVFRSIPDDATRLASLQSGQSDIASEILPTDVPALKNGGFKVSAIPSLRSMVIQYNLLQDNALHSAKVRQALNYAVNVKALIKSIVGGYGIPLQGQPLSDSYFGYDKNIKAFPYSPTKARQLLKEAGYTSDHPLTLTLLGPNGRYVGDKEVTEAVAGELQAVGVQVTPNVEAWPTYLSQLLAKSLNPMFLIGYATTPDAGVWYPSIVGSKGAYSFYKNATLDRLLTQSLSTAKKSARQTIYNKIDTILHNQAPFLYLYQGDYIYGVNAKVHGFAPNPDESIWMNTITIK